MESNPYSPPRAVDTRRSGWRHFFFLAMATLSAILALLVGGVTVVNATHNMLTLSRMNARIPPYVLLVNLLSLAAAGILIYASTRWRKQQTTAAIVSFVLAILMVVVAPYLLLMLLYGFPFHTYYPDGS